MRPRKRADWPVVVYQYWVRLEHETWDALPERVRQEAEAMHALWNHLANVFSQRRVLVQPTNESSYAVQLVRPYPSSSQLQRHLLDSSRQLETEAPIAWANKQFVLTRFQAAVTRFYKKQNRPPGRKFGPPEEVHFQHRFTSGGLPVARLFGRGQRVHIEPVAPEAFDASLPQRQRKRFARTTGSFLVGDVPLVFEVILHRPPPGGSFLKSATLIGKQQPGSYCFRSLESRHAPPSPWGWSLYLTLETPPCAETMSETLRPVAALNIDWQFENDERLRVAVLTDASGREEAMVLPSGILREWRYKRTLQGRMDRLVVDTKTQLGEALAMVRLPRTVRLSLAHLDVLRAPGLFRLCGLLEKEDCAGAMRDILRRWMEQFIKLAREVRGLEQRYLNHRDWFYRNTASQLCRRYQRLVISIASHGEADSARQLAAPGKFLRFLVEAAQKTHTEVQLPKNGKHIGGRMPHV